MFDLLLDDKLVNCSDGNGVGEFMDKKIVLVGGGRKRVFVVNSWKMMIIKNFKVGNDLLFFGKSILSFFLKVKVVIFFLNVLLN